ncbi:MAG: hypothetical protein ACFB0A_12680 [Croceivirga sp.]
MKYQKYLVLIFVGALFLPLLSAKSAEIRTAEFNISSLPYIEVEEKVELGFDTGKYLPESFDPYKENSSFEGLHYIEDDGIDLDFDTTEYLPNDFNPFVK